jgi:L1 cell adhesion molecule like protein
VAMQYLNMNTTSDCPTHHMLKEELWLEDSDVRRDVLSKVTKEIVSKYVTLDPSNLVDKSNDISDKVHLYACEFLSYGLLYLNFSDCIREGDDNRILRSWRYLMLVFKQLSERTIAL